MTAQVHKLRGISNAQVEAAQQLQAALQAGDIKPFDKTATSVARVKLLQQQMGMPAAEVDGVVGSFTRAWMRQILRGKDPSIVADKPPGERPQTPARRPALPPTVGQARESNVLLGVVVCVGVVAVIGGVIWYSRKRRR